MSDVRCNIDCCLALTCFVQKGQTCDFPPVLDGPIADDD